MKDDTAHATTPRSADEQDGLHQFKEDSVPPETESFGGLKPLWRLWKKHPFNLFGCFKRHDLRYDLARAGIIKDPASKRTDDLFYQDMTNAILDRDWPGYSTEKLVKQRNRFYRIVRLFGFFRWPKAARE